MFEKNMFISGCLLKKIHLVKVCDLLVQLETKAEQTKQAQLSISLA